MIPNLPRYYFQAVLTKSGIIKLVPCKFLYTRIWNRMRSRSQRWIRWSLGFPGIKLNPAVQSRLWASLKYDSCTYFHSGQLLNYGGMTSQENSVDIRFWANKLENPLLLIDSRPSESPQNERHQKTNNRTLLI